MAAPSSLEVVVLSHDTSCDAGMLLCACDDTNERAFSTVPDEDFLGVYVSALKQDSRTRLLVHLVHPWRFPGSVLGFSVFLYLYFALCSVDVMVSYFNPKQV